MNSPVDPALIQLVQEELRSLQHDVKNMSAECDKEKTKVQSELQNCISVFEEMKPRMERLESEIDDVKGRISAIEDAMCKAEGKLNPTMPISAVQHSVYSQEPKYSPTFFRFP